MSQLPQVVNTYSKLRLERNLVFGRTYLGFKIFQDHFVDVSLILNQELKYLNEDDPILLYGSHRYLNEDDPISYLYGSHLFKAFKIEIEKETFLPKIALYFIQYTVLINFKSAITFQYQLVTQYGFSRAPTQNSEGFHSIQNLLYIKIHSCKNFLKQNMATCIMRGILQPFFFTSTLDLRNTPILLLSKRAHDF